MPERDATLDAFIPTDTDPNDEKGAEPEGEAEGKAEGRAEPEAEAQTESAGAEPESTDPAVSTLAWSPEGAACATCGTIVPRRWRTDSGFVCEACVDWERTPNR